MLMHSFMECSADSKKLDKLIELVNDTGISIEYRRAHLINVFHDHMEAGTSMNLVFATLGRIKAIKSSNCMTLGMFAGAWPFHERKSKKIVNGSLDCIMVAITIPWALESQDTLWILMSKTHAKMEFKKDYDYEAIFNGDAGGQLAKHQLVAATITDSAGVATFLQPP